MSAKRCCVPDCDVTRSDNIPMHCFPDPSKDPERFRSWCQMIGGDIINLEDQHTFKNRRVCHKHFETEFHTWTRTLSANSIPTLLLPDSDGAVLHSFPHPEKDKERFTTWMHAVGSSISSLPYAFIYMNRKICADHFENKFKTGSGRLFKTAVPTLLMPGINTPAAAKPVPESTTVPKYQITVNAPRVLKGNAIPSVFPWTQASQHQVPQQPSSSSMTSLIFDTSKVKATYSRTPPIAYVEMPPVLENDMQEVIIDDPLQYSEDVIDVEISDQPLVTGSQETSDNIIEDSPPVFYFEEDENMLSIETGTLSVETQTDQESVKQEIGTSVETQTIGLNMSCGFSIHNYKDDEQCLHFYTGLENFEKIMLVFFSLGESVHKLNFFYGPPPQRIDALEQFFITLIILRRHSTFEEISMLFKITIKNVYSIFITWIRFMALQWRNIDLWTNRQNVTAYTPFDFNEKYPATRVVLDATEFPIKKPKLPLAQQVTFSSYKNRNTIKVLIGISPGGLISYISPAYGGSASDKQIIERSSILDRFDYNDEIMVDKDLNVQDIFMAYGVNKVNKPAFFKKGNQIGPQTLTSNRKVASKRVHVERVIGMLKTYKILTQPMNQTEVLLSSDIVFVVAMLINFRSNIINKNA